MASAAACPRCGTGIGPGYSYCPACGQPVRGVPGYPPPIYYPPPRKDNTALIVVLVVVLVVAVPVVLSAVLYIMVSGLIGSPNPPLTRPVIGMSFYWNTTVSAEIQFYMVQGPNAPGDFRINLEAAGLSGTPVPFPYPGGTAATVTVGSWTYGVTWTDVDASGTLSQGDTLYVSYPVSGGPPPGTSLTFDLLWLDGSLLASASWTV